MEGLQSVVVTEADGVEDGVHLEVVVVPDEVEEAAQGVAQTLSLSPTDILEFSSPRARTACWSRRTWSLEKPSTERREFPLRAVSKARRSSTVCGTLSVRSWLPVFLVVWTTSSSNRARRCSTSVLPAVPVSVT